MNKKNIVMVSIALNIILLAIIMILLFDRYNNLNHSQKSDIIGIYHNSNWYDKEASLQLKDNSLCEYPNDKRQCKWTISDKTITITLTGYEIIYPKYGYLNSDPYQTKEICDNYIAEWKKTDTNNDLENAYCEEKRYTSTAMVVNNGILLYDHIFKKIG